MASPVLIVGAGLSGLSAAWHLHRRGIDFRLIEARERVGGRALTHSSALGDFDLGPSWVWPGQAQVAQILQHFAIPTHQQFSDGVLLHQTADGQIHRNAHLKPMGNALRIEGGVGALVGALYADLPSEKVCLNTALESLKCGGLSLCAQLRSAGQVERFDACRVALALPPRLLDTVEFSPPLAPQLCHFSASTPTWMASHAKLFVVYSEPFWRQQGLSGDAFSATGVLAEIHDASSSALAQAQGAAAREFYALFAFVRLDAAQRQKMGAEALLEASVSQLVELFGADANNPVQTILQDWSNESYTASSADRLALMQHPRYGPAPALGEPWLDNLELISAETSAHSGGLIEGALQRGAEFAASCP